MANPCYKKTTISNPHFHEILFEKATLKNHTKVTLKQWLEIIGKLYPKYIYNIIEI